MNKKTARWLFCKEKQIELALTSAKLIITSSTVAPVYGGLGKSEMTQEEPVIKIMKGEKGESQRLMKHLQPRATALSRAQLDNANRGHSFGAKQKMKEMRELSSTRKRD